ncbi:MAG: 3-deoxy-D-manno-octulosonic acid transferase [Paludibacteraceae bacterium]|nr:3-deoxy-D-manno-octulosonic acid transferase [Paludibacteraceae bacterium]
MLLYFFLLRIAALFGHRKARLLVQGQGATLERLRKQPVGGQGRLLWFHAASAGEFEQARPLIERLRADNKPVRIVITFFSPSGYEMRKDYPLADAVFYLPFATRRNARAFIELLKPDMALFIKYEFWPAYLRELKKRGIPAYSISSVFRAGQPFFRFYGRPYLNVLRNFSRLYVQDEESRSLLEKKGISQVTVAGDTRFDRMEAVARQAQSVPQAEEFVHGDIYRLPAGDTPVIVAGSTWPEDEQLLARYMEERDDVKLILVPHEVTEEHLKTIFRLFKGRYVRFTRATRNNIVQSRVLVVDCTGKLSALYRYATAAYVGGGFGAGIHNTVEAAVYGVPVVFGPRYTVFREAVDMVRSGAAMSVRNYREFARAMDCAVSEHAMRGKTAAEYVRAETGATGKIYNELFDNI